MSESRVVLSGRFEVFPDGRINRIKDGVSAPAVVSYTGRQKKYGVVTYRNEKGKWTNAYVHRLVAAAFLPNPDHLPQVNHKDGNTRNNRVENLEWVTASQNRQHSYDIGLANPMATATPCLRCGSFTKSKTGVCPGCREEMKQEAYRIDHAADLHDRFSSLDIEHMPERMRQYVRARANGMSTNAIAAKFGVTRQAVSFMLLKAENRYQRRDHT